MLNNVKELKYGAKYPCMALIASEPENALPVYSPGFVASELVSVGETLNMAEGEFYADDALSESRSEFTSADLVFENKGFDDDTLSKVYGVEVVDGELDDRYDDNAPYIGFAFYRKLMDKNKTYYQGVYYPKCKAIPTGETSNTRGSGITFSGKSTTLRVYKCESGSWRRRKKFDTEAAAKGWVEAKINKAVYYEVLITVSGDGEVSPTGYHMVAQGANLAINIGGTPTKVYDNGDDVTVSVSDGVYTITAAAENHNIAVIYGG